MVRLDLLLRSDVLLTDYFVSPRFFSALPQMPSQFSTGRFTNNTAGQSTTEFSDFMDSNGNAPLYLPNSHAGASLFDQVRFDDVDQIIDTYNQSVSESIGA